MALIICPECAHEVSDKAVCCPNCGYPINGDSSSRSGREFVSEEYSHAKEVKKRQSKISWTILGVLTVIVLAAGAAVYLNFFARNSEQEEETAWVAVEHYNNCVQPDSLEVAIERYMADFSDGKHIQMVTSLRDRLLSEKLDWRNTEERKTSEAVNDFISRHPDGFFKDVAVRALDSLTYVEALESGEVEELEAYLSAFPDGKFASNVTTELKRFKDDLLTPEEEANVVSVVEAHFTALSNNDKMALAATLAAKISNYVGKANASEADVFAYANKVHESGKHKALTPQSFVVTKIKMDQGNMFNVKFVLEKVEEDELSVVLVYNGVAVVNMDGKISSLVLSK